MQDGICGQQKLMGVAWCTVRDQSRTVSMFDTPGIGWMPIWLTKADQSSSVVTNPSCQSYPPGCILGIVKRSHWICHPAAIIVATPLVSGNVVKSLHLT